MENIFPRCLRVIIVHMATYSYFGIIMSNVFDYGEIFKREIIRDYMLPMDEHNVILRAFLQPIHGSDIRNWCVANSGLLIEKKRGWLVLWGLMTARSGSIPRLLLPLLQFKEWFFQITDVVSPDGTHRDLVANPALFDLVTLVGASD